MPTLKVEFFVDIPDNKIYPNIDAIPKLLEEAIEESHIMPRRTRIRSMLVDPVEYAVQTPK